MRTRSELNQQAENLETEIRQLEARIAEERKEAAKVEEIIENSGKMCTSTYIILWLFISVWRVQAWM